MLSLRIHSIWSLVLGLSVCIRQGFVLWKGSGNQEDLFFLALSLFHFIHTIWFWKGASQLHFARASTRVRFLSGGIYLLSFVLLQKLTGAERISEALYSSFTFYLVTAAVVDVCTGIFTLLEIRKFGTVEKHKNFITEIFGNWKGLESEFRNRTFFAVYMAVLGLWVLSVPNGFLSFFKFSPSLFDFPQSENLVLGPIHLVGFQILILSYYNITAVTYKLHSLIEAGVRGGITACVFFLVLVLTGTLHPIVLFIPLVDFISLGGILLRKLGISK